MESRNMMNGVVDVGTCPFKLGNAPRFSLHMMMKPNCFDWLWRLVCNFALQPLLWKFDIVDISSLTSHFNLTDIMSSIILSGWISNCLCMNEYPPKIVLVECLIRQPLTHQGSLIIKDSDREIHDLQLYARTSQMFNIFV